MNSTNIASGQYESGSHALEAPWLEAFFEHTSAHAAFRLNDEGRIVTWSGGAARLFGYEAPEIVGSSVSVLLDSSDAENNLPQRMLNYCRSSSADFHQELWLLRKDGARFRTGCEVGRLPDPPGGFGVVVSDCSAQTREHQALEKIVHSFRRLHTTTQIRDRFLHVVAHELRTPLQAILGWVRLLRSAKLDTQNTERALEIIERSSRTQARMIEDLLDVSRLAAGSMHIDPTPVSGAEVLARILAPGSALRTAASSKNITIDMDLHADFMLSADAQRLGRAFEVLLQYIIHRSAPKSLIAIDLALVNNAVQVTIHAPGLDVSLEKAAESFDEPVADMSAAAKTSLGPGLAIARRIIELHKGSVDAEADDIGGIRFVVRLPPALS